MATEFQQVEFHVPGLCCLECSQGVETALRQIPGVQKLHVLSQAEKVLVTYDATTTQPEKLAQAVTDAGHPGTSWKSEGANTSSPQPQSRSAFLFALLRTQKPSHV